MKSFTEFNSKRVGLIALGALGAVVLAVLLLNRSFFSSGYTIDARFQNAAGLKPGTRVLIAGVPVGSVKGLELSGNSVLVSMRIDNGTVLPAQTDASINVVTVLGVLAVELEPISGYSHPLKSGAVITTTSLPVEFYAIENAAGNLLSRSDAKAFNQLLESLSQITAGKQQEVQQIISGLNKFTGAVDTRRTQINQLIDAANTLASTVASRDTQLASVIDNLSTVMAGLQSHSGELASLIAETDAAAKQTSTLLGNNQPQIQNLITNLTSFLNVVANHQLDLAQGVSYLGSALKGFSSVGYSGPQNTPNTWANIYTNLLGASGAYGAIGNCGALDQALNVALGPDPLACNQRSGPIPNTQGNQSTSLLPQVFKQGAGS
ncbi:MAG: MCE family protein [Acidimicrobiales bacterium]|nr:MCE family protein [Acidimicrobiales bacterium]